MNRKTYNFLEVISRVLAREMTRKEREEMDAKYFVFVSGGLVTDIRNAQGDLQEQEVKVIDFDNAEQGECQVCQYHDLSEPYQPDQPCPECGFNADEDEEELDAIRAYLAYDPQK